MRDDEHIFALFGEITIFVDTLGLAQVRGLGPESLDSNEVRMQQMVNSHRSRLRDLLSALQSRAQRLPWPTMHVGVSHSPLIVSVGKAIANRARCILQDSLFTQRL
jgi:hypothetical protein